MNRIMPVDGYVWCDDHGSIHAPTTDPYGYGMSEPAFPDGDRCRKSEHRPVFVYRHRVDDPKELAK